MTAAWSLPGFEQVALLIQREAGLVFPPTRRPDVEAAIGRIMATLGIRQISDFVDGLRQRHFALDDLIDDLTIGETYFFRNSAQIEFIRREILPEIGRRCSNGRGLRLWSAGCASGEEPFSLAILAEQEGMSDGVSILASDVSRTALARARTAAYGPRSFREHAAGLAERYFEIRGKRFVLVERLRQRVTFEHINLALDTYPSMANGTWGCDLILCRNVLIYFDRDTVKQVATRLFAALGKGGWLVCGASDPPLTDLAPFESIVTDAGVFYRRPMDGTRPLTRRSQGIPATPLPAMAPVRQPPVPTPSIAPRQPPPPVQDPIVEARKAYAAADYGRVIALTASQPADIEEAILRTRALGNLGEAEMAERTVAKALSSHPASAELHFLHAVLLLAGGHLRGSRATIQRALFLDRSLIVGHLMLGTIQARMGEAAAARRAYRNAHRLASSLPPDEIVPLSDGERADRLSESAKTHMALLAEAGGGKR